MESHFTKLISYIFDSLYELVEMIAVIGNAEEFPDIRHVLVVLLSAQIHERYAAFIWRQLKVFDDEKIISEIYQQKSVMLFYNLRFLFVFNVHST